MAGMIDWDSLDLPDLEDEDQIRVRIDAIHKQILEDKGLTTKPAKNSPGFAPTPHQAREVAVMSALGLDAEDIALVLNIELPLLKTYYTRELKVSLHLANAMVAKRALEMALSGRYPDMTKFWLKTRAPKAFVEKQSIDIHAHHRHEHEVTSAKDRLRTLLNTQTPPAIDAGGVDDADA